MPSAIDMGIDFKIEVDPEHQRRLDKLLRELGPRTHQRVSGGAVSAAATPILKDAKRRAKAHGWKRITESLGKKRKTYKRGGVVYVAIGPKGARGAFQVNVTHLLELGTRPHSIKKADQLGRVGGKTRAERGTVQTKGAAMHPGARPHPFLRPALESKAKEALKRYRKYLWKGVLREAKKLGKPGVAA